MDTFEEQPSRRGRGGGSNTWHRGASSGGFRANDGGFSDRGGFRGGGGGSFRGGGGFHGGSYRGGRGYSQDSWQGGGFTEGGGDRGFGRRGRSRSWRRGGGSQTFGRGQSSYTGHTRRREDDTEREEEEKKSLPPDVSLLKELTGHSRKITSIAFEPAADQPKVYTCSFDGTVKAWSAVTGEVVSSAQAGGEIDSMLLAGGFLFVAFRKGDDGIIKVWNLTTGTDHILTGHKGGINCLAIAASLLVSGGMDGSLRVWSYNAQAGIFMVQGIYTKEEGGHTKGIITIKVLGQYMYTSDVGGSILVWDLATGMVVQRIDHAHESPIMQLLPYEAHETFILSAGIDGLIKAWAVLETPAPGMVLKPEAVFVFDKDGQGEDEGGPRRSKAQKSGRPGILAMEGSSDLAGIPILMVVYNGEKCVRLFELPSFASRGFLVPVETPRTLTSISINPSSTVMMTGDQDGAVRIFTWKAPVAPIPPV